MLLWIDTFPRFLNFWAGCRRAVFETQWAGYQFDYLAPWPELLYLQKQAYAEEGEDWQAIARQRIFPALADRLPKMQIAHANLLAVLDPVLRHVQDRLGFDQDLVAVIYVGLGLGAGWATTYQGRPAILFGLENIAEEGWEDAGTLASLAAHEIGHLIHAAWRQAASLPDGSGPWWQLYCEGFAQCCETAILNGERWQHDAADGEWEIACRAASRRLARQFIATADAGGDIRPFFGSWFEVEGIKQAGYFLGQACIQNLEAHTSLAEIACLQDWQAVLRRELLEMCDESAPPAI